MIRYNKQQGRVLSHCWLNCKHCLYNSYNFLKTKPCFPINITIWLLIGLKTNVNICHYTIYIRHGFLTCIPITGGKWPFELGLWCPKFQLSSVECWDIVIIIFLTLIFPRYLISSWKLPCKLTCTLFMISYAHLHQSVNDPYK